jgi:drug/metabolite transporter (DMT)-like permease
MPKPPERAVRTIILTALAMIAFAANSVLARLAFATAGAEPMSYTGIRLASGALTLALLLLLRDRRVRLAGSWSGAASLFGYAIFFSIAYILLGAGTGALILFASVQIGILGWAIYKGDRPGMLEWLGLVVALGGLVYLVSPGLVAPSPIGAALMLVAGLCWAAYTLIGRGSSSPLGDTAGNFMRAAPFAVLLIVIAAFTRPIAPIAALYAIASGALASGLGYAVWYTVLPALSRTRSAIVQLTVPAIAAAGGVVLIGEPVSTRLIIASTAILGGVAIALIAAQRRRSGA